MLDEMKRRLRRLVRKPPKKKRHSDVRIPEGPQPGGPERPNEAITPPKKAATDSGLEKERHDGYSDIRPRRPGENTHMGRDIIPDITMPGRDLLPPEDDDEDRRKKDKDDAR
jgi:hypothetical protein